MKIQLSKEEIEQIINGLDIVRFECNYYQNVFDKFVKKLEDNGIFPIYNLCYFEIFNNAYQFGIQKFHIDKKLTVIGLAQPLFKKNDEYYLHGIRRYLSKEDLERDFWMFEKSVNISTSSFHKDIHLLFYRSNVDYKLRELIETSFDSMVECSRLNELENYYFKMIDLKKSPKVFDDFSNKLINAISENSKYDALSAALLFSLGYVEDKFIIDNGLSIILKKVKEEVSDEEFSNYVEFLKIQFPISDAYKCFNK